MENFKELVPLLFIAAYFLFGVLNKKRKAQQKLEEEQMRKAQQNTPYEPALPVLEDLLDKYKPLNEKEVESAMAFLYEKEEDVPPASTVQPFLTHELETFSSKSKLQSTLTRTNPIEDESEFPIKLELNQLSEVKKAIIYSEILRRRYE